MNKSINYLYNNFITYLIYIILNNSIRNNYIFLKMFYKYILYIKII